MMLHPLLPKLRQLRLSGMADTLDLRAAQATERQLSPVRFLGDGRMHWAPSVISPPGSCRSCGRN